MKILITTDTYAPMINGVVTSIQLLARALSEQGHDVRILTLAPEANFEGVRGNVYYLRSFRCGIYPDARITVPVGSPILRELERWHPNVIHSQTEFSSFLCARHLSKKLDIPLVHTYHTLYQDYTHYFSPNPTVGTLAARQFTRMISKSISLLCAPSVKVQRVLLNYRVHAPVAVLPTGIDLDRFRVRLAPTERRSMKRALGLPENSKVLLALGRIASEKNYDELLQNVAPVLRTRSDAYLLIVGDGPYRETLEAQVKALRLTPKVRFTGMVAAEHVPTYYQLGDVFICASSSETQGLTYLEAMASGIPQVVRADDCLKNVILSGQNGYQYQTAEDCAAYLHELLRDVDKHAAMSAFAAQHALRFGMEHFGARAAFCYEALTATQQPMRVPVLSGLM